MSDAPVLFMVFNRPETTAQVFESIRAARPSRLYVAADGPRKERPGEAERCAEARGITEQVDWPCEVRRLYRDENLGCKRAISSAITWFFQHEEEGIVLEDDCVPDPSFFPYCRAMLERYRDDERVMMVSGDDYVPSGHRGDDSYYFAAYFPIWGWATWRRAWQKYDIAMSSWPEFRDRGGVRERMKDGKMTRWMERNLELTYRGEINTWDFQWAYACLSNGGLSVCPRGNLVSNIGYEGTHMRAGAVGRLMNLPRVPFDTAAIRHPRTVGPDRRAQRAVYRAVLKDADPRGWVGKLDRTVYRTWQRVRGRSAAKGR